MFSTFSHIYLSFWEFSCFFLYSISFLFVDTLFVVTHCDILHWHMCTYARTHTHTRIVTHVNYWRGKYVYIFFPIVNKYWYRHTVLHWCKKSKPKISINTHIIFVVLLFVMYPSFPVFFFSRCPQKRASLSGSKTCRCWWWCTYRTQYARLLCMICCIVSNK